MWPLCPIRKVPEQPTWQSWPPCRNRLYLSSIFLPIIGSSNYFSEQRYGPNFLGKDCNTIGWQKGLVKVSEHLSPFHDSFPAPRRSNNAHCFCSRHPIPSNHGPGNVGLWTISHRPRLRTPALQESLPRTRRVYLKEPPAPNSKQDGSGSATLFHPANAKPSAIPTSIHRLTIHGSDCGPSPAI